MIIEQGQYENPDSGAFISIIADVQELGLVKSQFGEKVKIAIVWILDKNDSTGKPYRVRQTYNASMNEKSKLYEVVKGVLGGPPPARFDSETLLGRSNQLFIVKEKGNDGKDYSNVKGVLPVPAGSAVPTIPADFVRAKDRKPFVPSQPQTAAPAAPAATTAAPAVPQSVPQSVPQTAAGAPASSVNF